MAETQEQLDELLETTMEKLKLQLADELTRSLHVLFPPGPPPTDEDRARWKHEALMYRLDHAVACDEWEHTDACMNPHGDCY